MIDYQKLTDLFKTDEFQKEASGFQTMEDFHEAFQKNGIEVSLEETIDVVSKIAEKKQMLDNGEIKEKDLDNVAGGFFISGGLAIAACIGIGVVTLGTIAVSAYTGYQATKWANKDKVNNTKTKNKG